MADAIQYADQLMEDCRYQEYLDVLLSQEVSVCIKYDHSSATDNYLVQDQSDPNILWRKAKAMHKIAQTVTDKKQREDYICKGLAFAEEALKKDDKHYAVNNWYAILLGERAEIIGPLSHASEIANIRRHMITATELNPDDFTVWLSLGILEYSLADLPWYSKKLIHAMHPNLAKGTFEKALECFQKAESIRPIFYSHNNLMLGKTYMKVKENAKAKEQFNIVINMTVR